MGGYAKNGMNGCRCIKLDSDGGEWAYGQGWKKKLGKKSNKWAKTRHILNAYTQHTKPGSAQGCSWWTERIIRWNVVEGTGARYAIIYDSKVETTKQTGRQKKKAKPANVNRCKP